MTEDHDNDEDRSPETTEALVKVATAMAGAWTKEGEANLARHTASLLYHLGHDPQALRHDIAFATGVAAALLENYAMMLDDERIEIGETTAD